MLKVRTKRKAIKNSRIHKNDTGSAAIQISLLSESIKKLSLHLKKNKKDNHSRRGLLKMVAKRKKLVNYLKRTDEKKLKKIAKKYSLKI
ncbi:MAG: 30S ribosomal protein S15 [Patescibacteria group bacterium]|nr:30S ribosomal protein S15 [Patescibacteria group bacterium]